jgi:glyoxylase-like metal-dependent hydrolase (beta-lactamase superfamily II)
MSQNATVGFTPPTVHPENITEVADGVWVIPDSDYTKWVPNIGIIVGSEATLVIDHGLGTANATAVLEKARELSGNRRLMLTLTHFHPEHGYGAQVFADAATIFYNDSQWVELLEKGEGFSKLFLSDEAEVAPLLEDVIFVPPHLRYTGSILVELGGDLRAECIEQGGGHSRGDQVIIVHGSTKVLFTGDLVEDGYFGVLPDEDSHVKPWIERLLALEALEVDVVVPGHGLVGGTELIRDYREIFEHARDRVQELRAADALSDAEIVEQISQELVDGHPNWHNPEWAGVAVADLKWPARP